MKQPKPVITDNTHSIYKSFFFENLGMLGLLCLYCIFSFLTIFPHFFDLRCALQCIHTIRQWLATDLSSVRPRARANEIRPESNSVLRSVQSLAWIDCTGPINLSLQSAPCSNRHQFVKLTIGGKEMSRYSSCLHKTWHSDIRDIDIQVAFKNCTLQPAFPTLTCDHPALAILHFVNDLTCDTNRVINKINKIVGLTNDIGRELLT